MPAEAPWTQRGDPVRFRWADQGNYPEDTSYHGSVQNPPPIAPAGGVPAFRGFRGWGGGGRAESMSACDAR